MSGFTSTAFTIAPSGGDVFTLTSLIRWDFNVGNIDAWAFSVPGGHAVTYTVATTQTNGTKFTIASEDRILQKGAVAGGKVTFSQAGQTSLAIVGPGITLLTQQITDYAYTVFFFVIVIGVLAIAAVVKMRRDGSLR